MMTRNHTMNRISTIHQSAGGRGSLLSLVALFLVTLTMSLTGCRDAVIDRGMAPDTCPPGAAGEGVSAEIPVDLSLFATPTTRALSVGDESTLDVTKCRLFVLSGDKSTILYEGKVKGITPSTDDHQVGSISATLKPSTTPVTVVFVANLPETALSQAVSTVADLGKLSFSYPTDGAYTLLPAWGEVQLASISATGGTFTETLHLLRSVARIDVGLNLTALTNSGAKDPDFSETSQSLTGTIHGVDVPLTLSHTRLYNFSKTGLVAPAAANYDAANHKVSQPSLPAGTSNTTIAMADYSSKISANLLRREIYIPETANDNGTSTTIDKRPFLVVGLDYTEDGATKTTYYRIDFLTRGGARKYAYLPLLRNYRYKVNILEVYAPGFDTPDEAAKAPVTRLRYEVMAWQESEMGKVAYDGPYRLSVSLDNIRGGRFGTSGTVYVTTNWPKGWSVEQDPAQSWYKVVRDSAKPDQLVVTIDPMAATSTTPRSGSFYVRAGRMRWEIKVSQSATADLDIAILSDDKATRPLQFVELSQRGVTAPSLDSEGQPLARPGYRRFYVRTDPYTDPNTAGVKQFIPFLTHKGGSSFYFWDYGTTPSDPSDAALKAVDASTGAYPANWRDPGTATGATFFRYLGHDNLWECIVTAPPMRANKDPEDKDFFERRDNTYIANLQVDKDESTRVSAELRLLQMEYNAVPYDDPALTLLMIDDKNPVLALMDGTQNEFYITGNTPYTLKFLGAQSDITTNTDLLTDPLDGQPAPQSVTRTNYSGKYNTHTFTPIKDMDDPKRFHGFATYEVSSPDHLFDTYTFRIELASAIKQPEANSYIIKATSHLGILIPVSRVNTAADYYNSLVDFDVRWNRDMFIGSDMDIHLNKLDADDDFEPYMIWTDIGKPTKDAATGDIDLTPGGIKVLKKYTDSHGVRYLYVLPSGVKPTGGSALVGIRSGKIDGAPTLWSWHIWMVEEYPMVFHADPTGKPMGAIRTDKDSKPVSTLWILDRNLGAITRGTVDFSTESNTFGYAYQWGRKDPFPFYKQHKDGKQFWTGEGETFNFQAAQIGTGENRGQDHIVDGIGAVLTMKGSVERPFAIVAHQSVWMAEHLPFNTAPRTNLFPRATWRWLWEVPKGYNNGRFENNTPPDQGTKSPFDPSPAGMRLPMLNEMAFMRYLFYHGPGVFKIPFNFKAGTVNNGDYSDGEITVQRYVILAGASYYGDEFSGRYLRNIAGSITGWDMDTYKGKAYRRSMGFGVRPVADAPIGGWDTIDQAWVDSHITQYWPGYKKKP